MVRCVIAVFGILVLASDQSFSQYTNCSGNTAFLYDGYCDPETNNLSCGYDGGDCCACTCMNGPFYACGSGGFSCADPTCIDPAIAIQYPDCVEDKLSSVGDGLCDGENNNPACGYDGGDCCLCTCSGRLCGHSDFDCLDPSAGVEIYDCMPKPPASVPCSAGGQRVWVVEDSAQARALAEAVNCSGGSFEVLWKGEVVIDKTIDVLDGTFLNVTGADSTARMDGDYANRLFTVVDASVHVTGVQMSHGAGKTGGAVTAARSNLTFSSSTFCGDAATGHGGALYASEGSVVSFIGQNIFSDNTASWSGGAVFLSDSVCTGENVAFFNNTAGSDGGAMMITGYSNLSWSGKATYRGNRAVGSAGAVALQSSSSASWHGETIFDNNSAVEYAGALHVRGASDVAWNATTIFSSNSAGLSGGATRVTTGSSASWSGSTRYLGNRGSHGGAIMISMTSTAVLGGNTMFYANTASFQGGAVIVSGNSIVKWDGETTFRANLAGNGGAIYAQFTSELSFGGMTTFHENLAVDVNTSWGGALAVTFSTLTLSGETMFANNQALYSGGAVYMYDSIVASTGRLAFVNNSAGMFGGALWLQASGIVFHGNTSFFSNTATFGGAVAADGASSVSWDGDMEFHSNWALSGGALDLTNSDVSCSGNTLLVNNRALDEEFAFGGGVSVSGGSRVSWGGESSFINNSCTLSGGALSISFSSVVFDGNITFFGNKATYGGAVYASKSSSVSWDGYVAFIGNLGVSGGALDVDNASVSWSGRAILAHNRANKTNGGALWAWAGSRVSWSGDTTFNNNSAAGFGGAVNTEWDSNITWSGNTTFLSCAALAGGALFVSNGSAARWSGRTKFSSNTAVVSGGAVGSIFRDERYILRFSSLVIDGSTIFANNTAGVTGGGLALEGVLDVTFQSPGALFIGNSANVVGGAVFVSNYGAGPEFSGVKFVANFAGSGGGAYVTGSGNENVGDFTATPLYATKFDGCHFVDNQATSTGGAIESVAGQDHISNTVFIGNKAAVGGALRLGGKTFLDNCSFVDNTSGEGAGPAVDNIGFIGRITNSSFIDNAFNCQPGTFLEFNESGDVLEVACEGCRASCQDCTFEVPPAVPVCVEAMPHTTSSGGASTLRTLSINPGFWRATSTSKEVLACYKHDVCLGGVTGTPGYCIEGYEGPYCSICSDGYTASFRYACERCSSEASGIVLTVVFVVIVLVGAAAVASYTTSSERERGVRGTLKRLARFIPLQSIKIVIVALQIVTQFTSIANVTYPNVYQRFLDTVTVLNFDFGWIAQLSTSCLFDIGIHGRLLIATIGPIIAVLFLGLTYVIAAKGCRGSVEALRLTRHKHVSMVLLLTFLVYSSVSSILFQMFACDNSKDGKKYLRADYRVECDSSKHGAFQIYAGFMIFLYTIGVPALYASLLFTNRGFLKDGVSREECSHTQSFSDLWKPYKPSGFYYEVIECGRRVLLTGTVVFIYANTSAQIAVTLMIAFVFAMISEAIAPFASRWDTWISRMGHVVVFVSMYVALLLKVDVSNERSSSQKVFEGILVAAHLGMVLTVIVETGVLVCSLRQTVREGASPRFRGTTLTTLVPNER